MAARQINKLMASGFFILCPPVELQNDMTWHLTPRGVKYVDTFDVVKRIRVSTLRMDG